MRILRKVWRPDSGERDGIFTTHSRRTPINIAGLCYLAGFITGVFFL